MNEQVVLYIIEILLGGVTISGIAIILLATWYDIQAIKQKRLLQATAANQRKSRQPLVAILVYAHNNAATIISCLQSIRMSEYENYQIIVINNASTDQTEKVVTSFKRYNSKTPLLLYTKKTPAARSTVLHLGRAKARKHEYVLILDASTTIPSTLLADTVSQFAANEMLCALRLRTLTQLDRNIAQLPRQFIDLSKSLLRKAVANRTISRRNYEDSGVITRSAYFPQGRFPKKATTSYASTLTVTSSASQGHYAPSQDRDTPSLSQLLISIGIIMIVSYILYTAATLQTSLLLTLSWLLATLWLATVVWSDEILSLSTKVELSFTLPFMYFVFYVHCMVMAITGLWQTVRSVTLANVETLTLAVQLELYSTRY